MIEEFVDFIKYGTKTVILTIKFICLIPFLMFEFTANLMGLFPNYSVFMMLIDIKDETEYLINEIKKKKKESSE